MDTITEQVKKFELTDKSIIVIRGTMTQDGIDNIQGAIQKETGVKVVLIAGGVDIFDKDQLVLMRDMIDRLLKEAKGN